VIEMSVSGFPMASTAPRALLHALFAVNYSLNECGIESDCLTTTVIYSGCNVFSLFLARRLRLSVHDGWVFVTFSLSACRVAGQRSCLPYKMVTSQLPSFSWKQGLTRTPRTRLGLSKGMNSNMHTLTGSRIGTG